MNKIITKNFDTAINEMVKDKSIQVACPYINVKLFEDVFINECLDWELLTDIDKLKSSQSKDIE
jgi:hypothetical protein